MRYEKGELSALAGYKQKLESMYAMRESCALSVFESYQRRVRQFLLVEQEVQKSYQYVKYLQKGMALHAGAKFRMKMLAGRRGNFLIEGPDLYRLLNGNEDRLKSRTLTDISQWLAPVFRSPGRRELAEALVTLVARDRYYRQLGKSIREVHKILGVPTWETKLDGGSSMARFEKSREVEIQHAKEALSNFKETLRSLTEQVNQDCFDFNRYGGKWRGYRSLVLSWDVPRNEPDQPGAYVDYQPTYKFVAYNLTGHQITRPINQLEGASSGTRRITRQVIKLANQERFSRDIMELTPRIDQRLSELNSLLTQLFQLQSKFLSN